jgi:hypothetical protein
LIKPDYFARLTLDGLGFDAVLRHYVDWLLGLGEFDRLRQRRLGIGIQPAWASAELCAGANLNGKGGCRAIVIHQVSGVCIGLVHADDTNPRVFWHSVAVLTRSGSALLIEHAIGRAAPASLALSAVATSPAVLLALLDRDGVGVTPPELRLAAPVALGAANIPAFAKSLLATERSVPIALVAPQDRVPAIDVVRLARSLRSVAVVACLADHAALSTFNAAVDDRAHLDLGCAEQAVRLYFPIVQMHNGDSHPTWLAQHIRRLSPHRRTSDLAAEIIASVTARTMPTEFFGVTDG